MRRIVAAAISLCVISCQHDPQEPVAPDGVRWKRYHDDVLGVSLDYPNAYEFKERHGNDVVFTREGRTTLRISFVTEQEGKSRGLWVGQMPSGNIQINDRTGHRYDYTHWDGPFGDPTVAFVVPYRDRFLGLEFRSAVGPVEEAIVNSVKWDADERSH